MKGITNTWVFIVAAIFVLPSASLAESASGADRFKAFSIFSRDTNARNLFVEDVTSSPEKTPSLQAEATEVPVAVSQHSAPRRSESDTRLEMLERGIKGMENEKKVLRMPDEKTHFGVDKDAPASFKAMAYAQRTNDLELRDRYADQFVQQMADLMFTVRELTGAIGQAMVRKGQIDDDDFVGVPQFLDYELTKAREKVGGVKLTHEEAMKKIVADPENEIEIYYFFTLNCSWCRKMASDIERLHQYAKRNKSKVKMVGLTLGTQDKRWIDSYRAYTGLTLPIYDGTKVAKVFNVAFVPAVVIVSPNKNRAYLKTGQQSFTRLYEFARTVQGLPATISPFIQKLIRTPLGSKERENAEKGIFKPEGTAALQLVHAQSLPEGKLVDVRRSRGSLSPRTRVNRF